APRIIPSLIATREPRSERSACLCWPMELDSRQRKGTPFRLCWRYQPAMFRKTILHGGSAPIARGGSAPDLSGLPGLCRCFQRERTLVDIGSVAQNDHGHLVTGVAEDRGFKSHGVAVVPHKRMRIMQIQEPTEAVGVRAVAQGLRNVLGKLGVRACRQLRRSDCQGKFLLTQ